MNTFKRILSLITVLCTVAVSVPVGATEHTHTPDPLRTYSAPATCTVGGYYISFCSDCGEMTYLDLPAIGHEWVESDVEPTCEEEGYHLKKCSRTGCGEEERTNTVPKKDHVPSTSSMLTVITDPTCTEDGKKEILCALCMNVAVSEVIPSPGHNWKENYKANTCTEMGFHIIKCTECGEYDRNDVLDPPGHSWVEYDVEPTCQEKGHHVKECVNEGCTQIIRTRYTDTVDCKATEDPEKITVTATCTEDGERLTPCEWCGETVVREPVTALGHSAGEPAVTVVATCEDAGASEISCTVCGDTLEAIPIDPLGHDWLEIESSNADCTHAGYVVNECQRDDCGKTEKITTEPALEHDWNTEHTDGGCTGESYDLRTCLRDGCGATEKLNVTDAPGHTPSEDMTVTLAPTCLDGGTYDILCTECGEVTGSGILDALGHDWNEEYTDGGCTGESYIQKTCLRDGCGATEREDLISPGHTVSEDPAEWTVVESTCLDGGSVTKPCTVCGQVASVEGTDPLGHDWWAADVIEPTCFAEGYTLKQCRNGCGEEDITDVIPPLEHEASKDPADIQITVEPTCEHDGEQTVPCIHCGNTVATEAIPSLGHDWLVTDTVAATCTAEGFSVKTCQRNGCGTELRVDPVPALDHKNPDGTEAWGDAYLGTVPTEDTAGSLLRKCALCGEEKNAGEIPVLDGSGFITVDGVLYKYVGNASEVVIPDYVTEIKAGAFDDADGITVTVIPASVTAIDGAALTGIDGLTIRCYEGSAAQTYAEANSIPYELISDVTAIPGDADGNGKVTLNDVALALKHIAMWDIEADLEALDVNNDSKVNLLDVQLLLKKIAMWDVELV